MDAPRRSPRAARRKGHVVGGGLVRIGPLMAMPTVVRELGGDPDALFRGTGFDLARFGDPDTRVPYLGAASLIARCAEATACEHFGLLVGQRASPSSLGVAGFMLHVAPDVRTALHDLISHLDLHDDGGVPFVTVAGGVGLLGYAIHEPGVTAAAQIYDIAIAIACTIMRSLCGEDWRASEVLLSHRPPRDPAPWERFFRAPLRFDAEQSAVAFPARWLDHPLRGADFLLHRHLEDEAAALRARREPNLTGQVRGLLRRLLVARKTSVVDVAAQLGVHERTLNRRLRAEGTTFQREREQVLYATACQMLAESTMTLGQIAAALEYADASAFSRAFRRWSGATPAQWRAQRAARAD